MNKVSIVIAVLGAAVLGGGGGFGVATYLGVITPNPEKINEQKNGNRPLYYRHPMNPEVTSPTPRKDDMGMDFVPVYAEGVQSNDPIGTVKIDATAVQNIGVRTARAERRSMAHVVRALGHVQFDENKLSQLHPKTEGWVEKLHVSRTGDPVQRNGILLELYSPQLVSSQQEYLLALKNQQRLRESQFKDVRTSADELVEISRQRLLLLDVPVHQLRELEKNRKIKRRLHIHSPFSGIVLSIGVRVGEYITPRTELFQIADLTKVWVLADIYEYELPWVKNGDEGQITVSAIPDKSFKGAISYIYPTVDMKSRTIKVRFEVDNPGLQLKPGMFANVMLRSDEQPNAIVVPEEAVIRSGQRNTIFIVREEGKYEPREVKLGVAAMGYVQIIDGVEEDELVVTSSQFLIDSESKLREATSKMMDLPETRSQSTPAHDMSSAEEVNEKQQ